MTGPRRRHRASQPSGDIVPHPRAVPWWVREDLGPEEARRLLKALTAALTAALATYAPSVSLADLVTSLLDVQTGEDDRADIERGFGIARDAFQLVGVARP